MAQPNTKTPAMVLQELTVKKTLPPPEYILVRCKTGTHENEFHYKVNVSHFSGTGFGRSKQVAKHMAASNILEMLADHGIYDPQSNPAQEFNALSHRNETDSPLKPIVNFIGTLKDMCFEYKLPDATFNEISDVGPAHAREFTYECQMASITTQATANTKKQAKQLAAKDMLDKIKDVWPELAEQYATLSNALTDTDQEALARFPDLTYNCGVVPNRALKFEDFPSVIKQKMIEKNLKFDDFKDDLIERNKDSLLSICNKLDVKYEFKEMQQDPIMIALNLGLELPFSVWAMGCNYEMAEKKAIEDSLEMLEAFLAA